MYLNMHIACSGDVVWDIHMQLTDIAVERDALVSRSTSQDKTPFVRCPLDTVDCTQEVMETACDIRTT